MFLIIVIISVNMFQIFNIQIFFSELGICSVVKNIALIIDDAVADALCRANMTRPIGQEAS